MNRTQIIGNIGQDAEVRHIEGSQSAISFSVAVTEKWTDKAGNKQERTEWFRCTIWRHADKTSIAQYLKKGTKVLVEGKISARAWSNQNTGEVSAALELKVDNFEFLGGVQQAPVATNQPAMATPVAQAMTMPAYPTNEIGDPNNPDDDLPF